MTSLAISSLPCRGTKRQAHLSAEQAKTFAKDETKPGDLHLSHSAYVSRCSRLALTKSHLAVETSNLYCFLIRSSYALGPNY